MNRTPILQTVGPVLYDCVRCGAELACSIREPECVVCGHSQPRCAYCAAPMGGSPEPHDARCPLSPTCGVPV